MSALSLDVSFLLPRCRSRYVRLQNYETVVDAFDKSTKTKKMSVVKQSSVLPQRARQPFCSVVFLTGWEDLWRLSDKRAVGGVKETLVLGELRANILEFLACLPLWIINQLEHPNPTSRNSYSWSTHTYFRTSNQTARYHVLLQPFNAFLLATRVTT